jgi:aspartyl-tRNA(Asn)/glutamyl-tRNA(Gln) amidotransferase subunit C
MKLDQKSIEHLAHLARLSLDQEQCIKADLIHITDMIEQITLVNTEGVEPMAHPSQSVQRLRADVVTEPDQSALLAALAPSVEAGLFLVPTVLE